MSHSLLGSEGECIRQSQDGAYSIVLPSLSRAGELEELQNSKL